MQQNTIRRQRPPVWKVFFGLFGCFLAKKMLQRAAAKPANICYLWPSKPRSKVRQIITRRVKKFEVSLFALFTITTMVSVSTVQPLLNLEFLCTYKNFKMYLYTLHEKTQG